MVSRTPVSAHPSPLEDARHAPRAEVSPEIDWLKGFAIVCVVMIHAKVADGTVAFDNLIDRAVPIFVVLFGVTSELWWQRHGRGEWPAALGRWYATRWRRLMIPVWGMLLLWWPLVTLVTPQMPLAPRFIVATFAGYLPWIGTAWFVTLILELVVLFPLLRAAVDRLGARTSLVLSLAVLALYHRYLLETLELMRWVLRDSAPYDDFYYLWICPPGWFFAVVCGILLARRRLRVDTRMTAVCVALVAASAIGNATGTLGPKALHAAYSLSDPALTCLLLAAIPLVRWWPGAAGLLAWLGVSSWGIYLGQMLVHDAFTRFGYRPDAQAALARWEYFACLFAGGLILLALGNATRDVATRLVSRRSGA